MERKESGGDGRRTKQRGKKEIERYRFEKSDDEQGMMNRRDVLTIANLGGDDN